MLAEDRPMSPEYVNAIESDIRLLGEIRRSIISVLNRSEPGTSDQRLFVDDILNNIAFRQEVCKLAIGQTEDWQSRLERNELGEVDG